MSIASKAFAATATAMRERSATVAALVASRTWSLVSSAYRIQGLGFIGFIGFMGFIGFIGLLGFIGGIRVYQGLQGLKGVGFLGFMGLKRV